MKRAILTVLIGAGILSPAFAGSAKVQESHLIEGRCVKLKVSGQDATSSCLGAMRFVAHQDGVMAMTFQLRTGSALTFIGPDLPNPDADTDAFAVTALQVNLNIPDVPPSLNKASGTCTYTNPYAGPMLLRCKAKMDGRPFAAEFRAKRLRP